MTEIEKLREVSFRAGVGQEVVLLKDAISIVESFIKNCGVGGTVREENNGWKWVEMDDKNWLEEEVQKMEVGERVRIIIRKNV